nr:ATP-binding protein [Parasedimentitalea marina]
MLQRTKLGEYVKPLTNVYLLASLIETLENRDIGLPGIGVLHGEPGVGKTHAAMFASAHQDILHIQLTNNYTSKFLFEKILNELGPARKAPPPIWKCAPRKAWPRLGAPWSLTRPTTP